MSKSENIDVPSYLRDHSRLLIDIAENLKKVAVGILEDHGGIGSCGDLRAKEIYGEAGLLEYMADYMSIHADKEDKS